jgi:MFS family permease
MGSSSRTARQRLAVLAASLVGGSADVLDFLLPLWAGTVLGASSAQIGVLVSLELLVSFVARPLAGWLADTRERTRSACVGASLYGVGCLGYAAAPGLEVALVAAATTGAGGALLWVSVRVITAERLVEEPGAFAHLFSRVALASWIIWVPALVLLPVVGYRVLFAAFGLACLVGAGAVLLAGTRPRLPASTSTGRARDDVRRLGPLLAVVALTSTAEAGVGLLLLLHLQVATDLDVYQIALVFLPGGIALSVLPGPLHRLTARWGRRTVYASATCASALCAAGLAVAPGPAVIAALWVMSGASWAALTPVQEAVVAEISPPDRTGRGMSLLSNASLAGAAIGSAVAGYLYGATSWAAVCLVLGALLLVGAGAGPWALRRIGVSDRPGWSATED